MNKSFKTAAGATLGAALVFSISMSASAVEAPEIMPRTGPAGWGAQPPKVKRDPLIKASVERETTRVLDEKEKGKSVIEIQHWKTHKANVENQMPPSAQTRRNLTVHHTQEAVKHAKKGQSVKEGIKDEMRAHQNNMFYYNTGDGKTIDRTVTVNGESVIVRHKFFKEIFLGDTPYHYRIDATGEVLEGRELKFSAYSNTEYRTPIAEHITVVLEGDFRLKEKGGTDEPTPKQIESLVKLLHHLAVKYQIALANIDYHGNVADSECPGPHLIEKFPTIKARLQELGIK